MGATSSSPNTSTGSRLSYPATQPAPRYYSGQRYPATQPAPRYYSGQHYPATQPAPRYYSGQHYPATQPAPRYYSGQHYPATQPAPRYYSGQHYPATQPAPRYYSGQHYPATQPAPRYYSGQHYPATQPAPRHVYPGQHYSTPQPASSSGQQPYLVDTGQDPYLITPPPPVPAPPRPPSTELHLIEMPSTQFFPMWQAHMTSLLQHHSQHSFESSWEFVLTDCRLQYVELLKLDGAVEVEFFSLDDDDVFLAVPCDFLPDDITWKVNNLGWIKIPTELTPDVHRIQLSNEWWIGLRASIRFSIRSLMQYKLFADRFLRLFIVPIKGEDYMRVIVTSNMPEVLKTLPRSSSSVGARLLAQCLISKPPGEFPATIQDTNDGTQETHENEVYEYLTTEVQEPSTAQPTSPQLVFQCSDSITTPQASSVFPVRDDASEDKVSKLPLDDVPNAKPSAPPLTAEQPMLKSSEYNNQGEPSAPRLSDITSPKEPLTTGTVPDISSPTRLPLARGTSLDATVNTPMSPTMQGCMPLPVLLRQSSLSDQSSDLSSHLFPHQKRTVSWMLDIEAGMSEPLFIPQATVFGSWYAFTHGFEKDVFHDTVDVLVPKANKIALGGLIAHPVGSGKTVIAAELIRQTLHDGQTLVLVPGHIAKQWKKELKRFVPDIKVDVSLMHRKAGNKPIEFRSSIKPDTHVVIVPHDVANRLRFTRECPFRVIVDEPQDIVSNSAIFDAIVKINSPFRWLLTATPHPLGSIMQLALGYEENLRRNLPYDSLLSWFVRSRSRRDPPYLCLPVPPLHIHMRPVTLLWQETSVLHSYMMRDDLQAAIRLSSFFYFAQGRNKQETAAVALKGAQSFTSLDSWVHSHHAKLSGHLEESKKSLVSVEKRIAQEKASYSTKMKHQQAAEAQASPHREEEDGLNLEQVFEEGDEPGVSLGLLKARSIHKEHISNFERLLTFLSTISSTVTSDSECLICMNQLGGRVISMLPCLHSFCAECAAQLFVHSTRAPCPVCRQSVIRRQVCTFVCEEATEMTLLEDFGELRGKYGSKISFVIQEIARILKEFPDDKILVFGQWHDLLRQMTAAIPKKIKHCFLDGPLSQRCEIIEQFRTRPDMRVMLLSSESQSSGANLEIANHVIVIHPYCPANVHSVSVVPLAQAQAFEQQAVGRVLRFPQSKEVHLYRFYSLGTPEEELYTHWGWAGARQTGEVCRQWHRR